MKKTTKILYLSFFTTLLLYYFLSTVPPVLALSPTTSPTDKVNPSEKKDNALGEKINELKDKIASRVAQLKLTEKRGIIGTVSEVTDTTRISVIDIKGDTRLIDVDELTKFASPSAKESFGISDLKKGTTIGILGLYNKESQRIFARFISVVTPPLILHGKITKIDKTGYTITIATDDQKTYTADVENTTKISSYTKETGLVKFGFSKIVENEKIVVTGFQDAKSASKMTASRILILSGLTTKPTASENSNTQSSPSAQNVTPPKR